MLLDSEADIDKIQSVGSELKNCIKSIEWDLEDLDQTISILLTPKLIYIVCFHMHYSVMKTHTYIICLKRVMCFALLSVLAFCSLCDSLGAFSSTMRDFTLLLNSFSTYSHLSTICGQNLVS